MLLAIIVTLQMILYGVITYLSHRFDYTSATQERPLLLVIGLFLACFALHLWGLWELLTRPSTRRTMVFVVCAALAFRGIVLPSLPIQEVDIYRYIWDGAVLDSGVSPFAYSPQRVLEASQTEGYSDDLQKLITLRNEDQGLQEILKRVHYAELTTIYPPVSQVVFCLADQLTPSNSSLSIRVLLMKVVIVFFDVGVVVVLAKLLALMGLHNAWLIPYAWSPLVMKEFANSGHLDSIAVFLTVLAVYWATRVRIQKGAWNSTLAAGLFLGLGAGAKLFPIVLLPLLCFAEFANRRWASGVVLGFMTVLVATVSLFQMFWDIRNPPADQVAVAVGSEVPPLPTETADNSPALRAIGAVPKPKSEDGLSTFLSRWEMNDLIFMAIEENIREPAGGKDQRDHWFVIVPQSWRIRASRFLMDWTGLPPFRVAFVATRLLTLLLFAGVGLLVGMKASLEKDAFAVVEAVFLTLAWFWLLSPTQNPWYWTWALPFVVFARNRTWLLVGGVSLLYYLRFWLLYHYDEPGFLGSGYTGTQFFDFVLVWGEFGPCLVLFLLVWLFRRHGRMPSWLYRTSLGS